MEIFKYIFFGAVICLTNFVAFYHGWNIIVYGKNTNGKTNSINWDYVFITMFIFIVIIVDILVLKQLIINFG